MATSFEFSELADEWLVTYAQLFAAQPIPTLFTIGHCLEAFCKSAVLKHNPSAKVHTHDTEKLIGGIQQDIGLLKNISFLPNVESKFMTGGLIPHTDALMADPEYLHFIANQELYWVAKFQKELKYFGTSGKDMPLQFSIFVMPRNQFWVPIIKELRSYVRAELPNESLAVRSFMSKQNIPAEIQDYMGQFCLP